MKHRSVFLLAAMLAVVACGGATDEPAGEPEAAVAAPEAAPMDDAAALDERTEYFVTHYNMHHPDMVAELYTEDAVFLSANGSVQEGREAIREEMQRGVAGNPTLQLDVADRIITGEWAVSHGVWALETTPEGAPGPLSLEGHFMTVQQKIDGEWMTGAVITNYNADPPEGTPVGEPPAEDPPEAMDSPLAELADYYATHYNMGHGDMVASRYEEGAMASFPNLPVAEGRAAIAERLNARIAAGNNPQLTVHEVANQDLGDGWIVTGGWYEMASTEGNSEGSYILLCRPDADGNMQIHWSVSNGHPVAE